MLIIDSKDCENIDKALKKYKKKFEKSRVLLQLRERQAFIKPSVRRRGQVLKAVYKQQIASGKIEILFISFTTSILAGSKWNLTLCYRLFLCLKTTPSS